MTTRPIDAASAAMYASSQVFTVVFIELDFNPDALFLWTGIGPFTWGDKTFTGAGGVLSVGSAEEATETRAVAMTLTLSALDPAILPHAINADYRGKLGTIWLAGTDAGGTFLDDPSPIYVGKMDVMTWTEGAKATISMTIESKLADLDRARVRRYTDRDQQNQYPGDLGMQYVDSIQNTTIQWGQGISSS